VCVWAGGHWLVVAGNGKSTRGQKSAGSDVAAVKGGYE